MPPAVIHHLTFPTCSWIVSPQRCLDLWQNRLGLTSLSSSLDRDQVFLFGPWQLLQSMMHWDARSTAFLKTNSMKTYYGTHVNNVNCSTNDKTPSITLWYTSEPSRWLCMKIMHNICKYNIHQGSVKDTWRYMWTSCRCQVSLNSPHHLWYACRGGNTRSNHWVLHRDPNHRTGPKRAGPRISSEDSSDTGNVGSCNSTTLKIDQQKDRTKMIK